jgi:hypothetical protein
LALKDDAQRVDRIVQPTQANTTIS